MTMTPDEWLADFESKVVDMQHKAAAFRRKLEQSGKTIKSEDGRLEITVAPNGALVGLKIADDEELAEDIMELAREAREKAAEQINDSFRPLAGCHVDELDTDTAAAEPEGAPEKPETVHPDDDDEVDFDQIDFSDPSTYDPEHAS